MTDRTDALLPILVELRADYLDTRHQALLLLRLLSVDAEPFLQAHDLAQAESSVDTIIMRASVGGKDVSEHEIRAFAAVHFGGVERACRILEKHEIAFVIPERLWRFGIHDADAEELLGIPYDSPFETHPDWLVMTPDGSWGCLDGAFHEDRSQTSSHRSSESC